MSDILSKNTRDQQNVSVQKPSSAVQLRDNVRAKTFCLFIAFLLYIYRSFTYMSSDELFQCGIIIIIMLFSYTCSWNPFCG
jgi:hypothetical protein